MWCSWLDVSPLRNGRDVLIKAVSRSRYADQIQLVLAGKGPRKDALLKLAEKEHLTNPIQIHFFSEESSAGADFHE